MAPDMGNQKNNSLFQVLLLVEALQETSRRGRSKLCRHPGKSQEDIGWTEALCKDMTIKHKKITHVR